MATIIGNSAANNLTGITLYGGIVSSTGFGTAAQPLSSLHEGVVKLV